VLPLLPCFASFCPGYFRDDEIMVPSLASPFASFAKCKFACIWSVANAQDSIKGLSQKYVRAHALNATIVGKRGYIERDDLLLELTIHTSSLSPSSSPPSSSSHHSHHNHIEKCFVNKHLDFRCKGVTCRLSLHAPQRGPR
jgi:hypothetical protein